VETAIHTRGVPAGSNHGTTRSAEKFKLRSMPMQQLITNIVTKVGIDEDTARTAVGIILNMFAKEAPADKVDDLMNAMPGAQEVMAKAAAADAAEDAGDNDTGMLGGLGSMVSGALGGVSPMMGALSQMQEQGMSVDQAKQVGQEFVGYAREQVGDEKVKELASSIPGLDMVL